INTSICATAASRAASASTGSDVPSSAASALAWTRVEPSAGPSHAAARAAAWACLSSLRRSSATLCSRCASSASARPFSDSGGRAPAMTLEAAAPAGPNRAPLLLRRLAACGLGLGLAFRGLAGGAQRDAQRLAHLVLDLDRELGVLAQE